MTNGNCPLHPGLEGQIRQLVSEVREGNREARQERQSITAKMNKIDMAVVRIEAKSEGMREATGEAIAKTNKVSGIMKWVIGAVAVLVTIAVALLR